LKIERKEEFRRRLDEEIDEAEVEFRRVTD
jgi:hypothetical protein